MRTVYNLLQASLKINVRALVEDAMADTASDYVQIQKDQMFSGVLSDGSAIQRLGASYSGYAPATIKAKEKKGQPTDRVTLKDTSDFYNGIFAEARQEGFNVDSLDPKSAKLQTDYSEKIYGLSPTNKPKYAVVLLSVIRAKFLNEVNIGTSAPKISEHALV